MLKIVFKYFDPEIFEEVEQYCIVETIEECKEKYSLGDKITDYSFLKVENDKECEKNNRFILIKNREKRCDHCYKFNYCKEIHKIKEEG